MFYRRKILISLLASFGGKLDKIDLQKLLFLFSNYQKKPLYHFIPYQYGCYSYQANADLNILQKYGIVKSDKNNWYSSTDMDVLNELGEEDKRILKTITAQHKNKLGAELIQSTYLKFPYYAINSKKLHELLSNNEINTIIRSRPVNNEIGLYTIGYEGISLEEYFNKLIKYDIKALCDVRKNPISMKYGFSKSQLSKVCENLEIKYTHIPNLGIDSNFRKDKYKNNYKAMFDLYKSEILPNMAKEQDTIIALMKQYNRVAITCFEANLNCCHRLHLAEALAKRRDWSYNIYHI